MKKHYLWFLILIVLLVVFVFYKQAHAPEVIELEEKSEVLPSDNFDKNTNDNSNPMSLSLTSSAFVDGGLIPSRYTCDGEGVNPELIISGVPEGTKSLVLVMDDPDIPDSVKESRGIEKFDHWVMYNIPPETNIIKEGVVVGSEGLSSRGETGYVGACPPDREHRYFFRLYALPNTLSFIKAPTLDEVEIIAKESAIENAVLMGRYERVE